MEGARLVDLAGYDDNGVIANAPYDGRLRDCPTRRGKHKTGDHE